MPERATVITAAACAALVGAFVAPAALAGPETASAGTGRGATVPAPRADFNGDGYPDAAVAAPGGTVNGQVKAGYVVVLFGSPKGIATTGRQMISKDSPGIPGVTEKGGGFGARLATGDLDGDGFADLVVNTPYRWSSGSQVEASQTVVWGGPRGLSGGAVIPGSHWSSDAATGDFNGDGRTDLASLGNEHGEIGGTLYTGPFNRSGTSAATAPISTGTGYMQGRRVAAGDVSGDGTDDLVMAANSPDEPDSRTTLVLRGGPSGLGPGTALTGSPRAGGEYVAVGDVNCDGVGDIVVGHAFDGYDSDVGLPSKGGAVIVVHGRKGGPAAGAKPVWVNQATRGVPGTAESGDGFGTDVTTGDTDGDGCDDVVAGLPGEAIGTTANAGSAVVLKGSRGGLTGTGAKAFHQGTRGVPGAVEKGDHFGLATRLVDGNGDGRPELAVGAPHENSDDGSVWILPAGRGGLTANGTVSFSASLGTPITDALLGSSFSD